MKKSLNITLVQSNIFWQDVDSNLAHFEYLISKISKTDIILLPEMFNTAFCPTSKHLAEPMNGNTVMWMQSIARKNKCAIAGTLMINAENKIFNRLVWISKNDTIYTYDKSHLFSLAQEQKYISKGNIRLIINEEGWKICPLICYDLRFPVFSRNDVDYDILIYLANWPEVRIDAWDTLLKARSIENQCYTIGVNRIGEDDKRVLFNGHSVVFDAFGTEVVSSKENKEAVLQFDICSDDLLQKNSKMNFLNDKDKFKLV